MKAHSLYIIHPGRLEDIVEYRKWQAGRMGGGGGLWVAGYGVLGYKYVVEIGFSYQFRLRTEDLSGYKHCFNLLVHLGPFS